MDTSGREDNNDIKSKMTYFYCGLSIAYLIFTLLINFKKKKNEDLEEDNSKTKIVCSLSICLLVVNIIVILAMDKTDNKAHIFKFKKI